MGNKVYRESHKAQGLCVDCSSSTLPNRTLCALCSYKYQVRHKVYRLEHRGVLSEKSRELRKHYAAEGRCSRCGAPLIEEEQRYCFACLARTRKN